MRNLNKQNGFMKKPVLLFTLLAVAVSALAFWQTRIDVPDFQSFESAKEKKQAFFGYFLPLVEQENERISALRAELKSNPDQGQLEELAEKYRLEVSNPATKQEIAKLLRRIDVLPASLVLSQAAIESGWGTSRFATEGYNFFGQWCYTEGCGFVPSNRNKGAKHEVREFGSPEESVRAYFLNINSHPTYVKLRDLRAKARQADKPPHGCVLAAGLDKYSERGHDYIEEVRQMIRINKLSPYGLAPCKASAA